jgi:glycosyltransferase involved in cell wall biosynthesis
MSNKSQLHITISAVLAVKNEENILKDCLDALFWVDEIIIIDNGSTDRTIEIAKRYTNKVYSCPEKKLIPSLQNEGIKKATKDWILILDADVIVPDAAAREIKEKITDSAYDGYYLLHKTFIMGRFMVSPFWTFPILKLFRRGAGFFPGQSAHEPLTFHGKVGNITNPLLHYSHPLLETEVRKINLYSSQDAERMFQQKKGGILNRMIKKPTLYRLIMQPLVYFFYLFVYMKGYKDGIHGFIVSTMMSFYVSLETMKVFEYSTRNIPPNS